VLDHLADDRHGGLSCTRRMFIDPLQRKAETLDKPFQPMQNALAGEYRRLCSDAAAHQPLAYLRLRRAIRNVIEQRAIEPGQTLPSERDLAQLLALSRVTVRKAIAGLVEEGVLTQRHGAGTFVAERIIKPMSRLTSFTEDLRARGLNPRSEFFERDVGEVTPEESMALNLSPGVQVVRLHRVRYAGDEPLAIERTVVPASGLPSPSRTAAPACGAAERPPRPPAARARRQCRPQHRAPRLPRRRPRGGIHHLVVSRRHLRLRGGVADRLSPRTAAARRPFRRASP
jgi:DNA-binding transcriptional regulator YhcF (GntR family)